MASVVLTVGMGAFLLLIHSSRLAVYLHKEYEFNMVQHEFEPLTPSPSPREGEGNMVPHLFIDLPPLTLRVDMHHEKTLKLRFAS